MVCISYNYEKSVFIIIVEYLLNIHSLKDITLFRYIYFRLSFSIFSFNLFLYIKAFFRNHSHPWNMIFHHSFLNPIKKTSYKNSTVVSAQCIKYGWLIGFQLYKMPNYEPMNYQECSTQIGTLSNPGEIPWKLYFYISSPQLFYFNSFLADPILLMMRLQNHNFAPKLQGHKMLIARMLLHNLMPRTIPSRKMFY